MFSVEWLLHALTGLATGVLSSWGIGGGSLLMIYMTGFAGIGQKDAQGINLLYFLPVSAGALGRYIRTGRVNKKATVYAVTAGLAAAGLGAFFATRMDTELLRRIFGVFLLYIGIGELLKKGG